MVKLPGEDELMEVFDQWYGLSEIERDNKRLGENLREDAAKLTHALVFRMYQFIAELTKDGENNHEGVNAYCDALAHVRAEMKKPAIAVEDISWT
jgi:hypothetical protein